MTAAVRGRLDLGVLGVGLLGPGLPNWAAGQALLRTPEHWQQTPTVVPPPTRLPANERRRAGLIVKATIEVAEQACSAAGVDPGSLATVFTSSTGDPANCHALCEALASSERLISPTRFTNSVHNVAAGCWHIATRSMQPSTSLGAFDASFSAGLFEAAVQCLAAGTPVLLVAGDVPYPEPLHALRPLADTMAVALLLVPEGGRRLALWLAPEQPPSRCPHAGLETLRTQIPAARALPLLQALASPQGASLVLESLPGHSVQVMLE